MRDTRLYIVQIVSILVLLCGYFLSDQPDSLSIMHFDPSCPSVITTKAPQTGSKDATTQSITSTQDSRHKIISAKYISYEIMLPPAIEYATHNYGSVVYVSSLHIDYRYLFYKEINPPPPKVA